MAEKNGYKITVVNLDTGATVVDAVAESVFGVILDLYHSLQTVTLTGSDPNYESILIERVLSEAMKLLDKIEQTATPELKAALKKLLSDVWKE